MRGAGPIPVGRKRFPGAFAVFGLCWAIWFGAPFAGAAEARWPEDDARRREFSLPTDPASWGFVRSESADAPPGLRALSEKTGVPWSAVWDFGLDVPHMAAPRGLVSVIDPPEDTFDDSDVERAASAFINDRLRDVFGFGTEKLGPLEVLPFGQGRVVVGVEGHADLAVRGSILRLRIDGEGNLRSLSAVLAKDLPPMEPVRFDYGSFREWERRVQTSDGLSTVVWLMPQILFAGGLSEPVAGVFAAGIDATGRELEVFRRLEDGELLLRRETAVRFGETDPGKGADDDDDYCNGSLRVTVQVDGYYPPPDDPYRLAFQYDPRTDLWPIVDFRVYVESAAPCLGYINFATWESGIFKGGVLDMLHPWKRKIWLGFDSRAFYIAGGHPDYLGVQFDNREEEFHYRKTFT